MWLPALRSGLVKLRPYLTVPNTFLGVTVGPDPSERHLLALAHEEMGLGLGSAPDPGSALSRGLFTQEDTAPTMTRAWLETRSSRSSDS